MDAKLSSALGIILLAVVTWIPGYAPGGRASSEPSGVRTVASTTGAQPKGSKGSEDKETELVSQSGLGPWYATCQFSNPRLEALKPPSEKVPLNTREMTPVAGKWCLPKDGVDYHFLFATVPDPVDSHLALEFDRRIEAILDAAQASGFSYDRYWLPWEPGYVPVLDNSHSHEKILHQLRAEQPGLLLLRRMPASEGSQPGTSAEEEPKSKSNPEILFVFLIGETPTAGIHRLQFANAMQSMKEIDSSQFDSKAPTTLTGVVRVLGPSFSGSAASLLSFLKQFQCKSDKCFHLVSSSATHRRSLDTLARSRTIGLKEVLHDDDYSLKHFLRFLSQDLKFKPWEVALLTEDTTEYGQVDNAVSDPANEGSSTGDRLAQRPVKGPLTDLQKVLTITFPREIAQLRNAYPDPKAPSPGGKDNPTPQQGLTLTLKGSPTSQDDVPPFSGEQLPLSQEAVLLNIANTLRREQVRFVGIFATDVFDTLFLSRFLRSACPDIRIFIVQSDLLMTRATEEIPLQGALAVTTYPLIGRNQYWTASSQEHFRQRNLLSSATAQSTYNASIVLLSEMVPPCKSANLTGNTLLERPTVNTGAAQTAPYQAGASGKCPNPYAQAALLEYSSPTNPQADHPPLWVTVIGRDGYLPLALLDEGDGQEGGNSGAVPDHPERNTSQSSGTPNQEGTDAKGPGEIGVANHIWHWQHPADSQPKHGYAVCRTREEALECEPPPLLWTLVFGIVSCWSLLYVAVVWLAIAAQRGTEEKHETRWLPRRWWLEDFAIKQGNGEKGTKDKTHERSFYLLMESLVSAAIVMIVSAPGWRLIDWESSPFVPHFSVVFFFTWVSPIAVLSLMGTAAYLSGIFYRSRPTDAFSYRLVWAGIGWLLFLTVCYCWMRICFRDSASSLFFDYRSLDLASSASPVTPFVLLLAGFCAWARIHMQRLRFSETRKPTLPSGMGCQEYDPATGVVDSFESAVCEFHDPKLFWSNLVLFVVAFFLLHPTRFLRTLEGIWFDGLYILFFAVLYYAIASNWIRFLMGWLHLRQLLRRLEQIPLRFAFNRLAKEFSWAPIWKQGGTRRTYLMFTRSNDYLQVLAHSGLTLPSKSEFLTLCNDVKTKTEALLRGESEGHWDDAKAVGQLQGKLTQAANLLIQESCAPHWAESKPEVLKEAAQNDGETAPREDATAPAQAVRLAEEYVALRCLAFVRYASLQLRNLLGFLTTAFILSLISLRSYPFQEPRSIGWSMTLVFVILGLGIVLVFAEMDKDHILSRVSNTNPGKLDKEFFLRVISFGALPLLTVIASQFPSIGRFLFSWVQPGLETLR